MSSNNQAEKINEQIRQTLQFLNSKTKIKPKTGLILGSGLGSFAAKNMNVEVSIPFHEIPHFSGTTVVGHSGNLVFGTVHNHPVVVMQGRIHFYEGHSMNDVVFPTRVLSALGIENLIVTNSAGGLADKMTAGDLMIIEDHINLMGTNPLIGPNFNEWGPRFPDMTEAYNHKLTSLLEQVFMQEKIGFKIGIYCAVTGPSYETPAEVRYLKHIGGSAVGMSTAPEVIVANQMGIKVVGLSCITNLAAGLSSEKLTHTEVTETAKRVESDFCKILSQFIQKL
jgi:purine-nucleoside phosphorylase